MKKIILAITVVILLTANVAAIGISPSSKRLIVKEDQGRSFTYFVINNEHKDMKVKLYTEGNLSKYATLNIDALNFSSGEEIKEFKLDLDIPDDLQGASTLKVIAEEVPPEEVGIRAVLGAVAKLNIIAPHEGKHIVYDLDVTDVEPGKPVNFTLKVHNIGTESTIIGGNIEIDDPQGNRITTLNVDKRTIGAESSEEITIGWSEYNIKLGAFYATAKLTQDGAALKEVKKIFMIGEPFVAIKAITSTFLDKRTLRFDIDTKSEWNQLINHVGARIIIKDQSGAETKLDTSSADLQPFSTKVLSAYWESEEFPEDALVTVLLDYADRTNMATASLSQIISEGLFFEEERSYLPYLVIFTSILLILSILVIIKLRKILIK